MAKGICCPFCNDPQNKVVDVRRDKTRGTAKRRRECSKCKRRWVTYEVEADRLHLLEEAIRGTG